MATEPSGDREGSYERAVGLRRAHVSLLPASGAWREGDPVGRRQLFSFGERAFALEGRAAEWVRRTARPKLVVASQTRVVEVVVDDAGAWVPGVPLVVVLAPSPRLWPLAAALASPAITAWVLHRTAGTALTPQALKVTATLLRDAPLPTDEEAWARGTAAFRSGDLDGFGDAMAAAYGTGAELTEWWAERAKRVWSPNGAHR